MLKAKKKLYSVIVNNSFKILIHAGKATQMKMVKPIITNYDRINQIR